MIFGRFIVSGHSMQPTYKSGDQVILWKFSKIKKGDVIVFAYGSKKMIKRVVKLEGEKYFVKGDNANDSMPLPPIKKRDIIGKVIFTL